MSRNVALGHTSKMRWNPADKWVFSEQIAHPPIIGTEDFELGQATLAGRGSKTQHRQHRQAAPTTRCAVSCSVACADGA